MPITEIEGFPTPSLVDRLSNDEPDFYDSTDVDASGQIRRQANKARTREAVKRYEDSVRRDLEWLFNSRRVKDDRLAKYPELQSSVFCYGIPDLNSEDPSRTHDKDELLHNMEDAVARFDRRLCDLTIEFGSPVLGSHLLHFQISGVVMMDPVPAEVAFQSSLDPIIGECKVS
ncbi:MAG: type VI secretion system baseplate subunit TssE [Acidobacteria bacterium]|nr:MAG: type VI secretion system baseplate subunit TssE [Acidobacteriota bacterium]PYY06723.1 MAG: type VI secretion system baseplate subunit TssE [Acidobacteriota bacterium]PYY23474.1 MAG: type VI secretion system baseplate subunit TssE [Acidobacteriota bacterium]